MITIIVNIALIGFLAWLVTYLVPMPEKFKVVIQALALILILLYVLGSLGLYALPTGLR